MDCSSYATRITGAITDGNMGSIFSCCSVRILTMYSSWTRWLHYSFEPYCLSYMRILKLMNCVTYHNFPYYPMRNSDLYTGDVDWIAILTVLKWALPHLNPLLFSVLFSCITASIISPGNCDLVFVVCPLELPSVLSIMIILFHSIFHLVLW